MATKRTPPNPVTPQGRDCFILRVREWQDKLNLNDWRIEPSDSPAAKANAAEINKFDLKARLATYRVGADFGAMAVTDMSIEQIACHEVLHVFLHELLQFAQEPGADAADIDSAEHRVINTLVHLLVPMAEPVFVKKA